MQATNEAVMEQSNILKEIRDEIRSSRTTNPYAGAASGVGRPSSTFVQSQLFMDRVVSGEWASMGWANAYTSRFESSWKNDLAGAYGLTRSPNTMTQMEFQHNAYESLNNRVSRFMGGVISPFHTGTIQHLGQDIFENSQRFARFGDPMAGVLGSGVNFGMAQNLAQKVTNLSFNDMRMSAQDYGDTVSIGMKMSQFDHVKNSDDFIKKTKELATAVGDLTRTLHLSVKEISESMGSMRQYGIVDVADQRRTLMHIQGMAQVGGMTTGQAMGAWSAGAQTGNQLGVSAQVAGQVGVDNLAQVRDASRAGIVSQNVMALGGGAEGISKAVTDAQLKHLSSTAGFLQYIGGGGGLGDRDSLGDMWKGLSGLGGMDGILNAQARKMEFIDKLKDDPDKVNRIYAQNIERQLKFMGITDMTSERARDRAFYLVHGEMGDAAGLYFANQNFSEAGRINRDSVSWKSQMSSDIQANKLQYDNWAINNTPAGRLASGLKNIRSIPAQIANRAMNWFEGNGQSGMWDWSSPMQQNALAHQRGAVVDTVGMDDFLDAVTTGGPGVAPRTRPKVVDFDLTARPAATYGTLGHVGGIGLGTLIGGLPGLGAGIITNGFGLRDWGEKQGRAIDGEKLRIQDTPGNPEASLYLDSLDASTRVNKVSASERKAAFNALIGKDRGKYYPGEGSSSNWGRDLLLSGRETPLIGQSSLDTASHVRDLSKQTGISQEALLATLADVNPNLKLEKGNLGYYDSELTSSKNMKEVIGGKLLAGVDARGIDFANTANASALRDLLKPYDENNKEQVEANLKARKDLTTLGLDAKGINTILSNAGMKNGKNYQSVLPRAVEEANEKAGWTKMGDKYNTPLTAGTSDLYNDATATLDAVVKSGAERDKNQVFSTGMDIARGLLSDNKFISEDFKTRFGNSGDFLGLIHSGGPDMEKALSAKSAVFRNAYKIDKMSDLGKLVAFGTDQANPDNMIAGIGQEQINAVNRALKKWDDSNDGFVDSGARQRRARELYESLIAHGTTASTEAKNVKTDQEAQLFQKTATILEVLAKKLELAG